MTMQMISSSHNVVSCIVILERQKDSQGENGAEPLT